VQKDQKVSGTKVPAAVTRSSAHGGGSRSTSARREAWHQKNLHVPHLKQKASGLWRHRAQNPHI
jgi:hypothetical protein